MNYGKVNSFQVSYVARKLGLLEAAQQRHNPQRPMTPPAFIPLNKRSGGHIGGLLQSTRGERDLDVG